MVVLRSTVSVFWAALVCLLSYNAAFALNYIPSDGSSASRCRCKTSDGCFPGADVLSSFNNSVGGRLILPHPTAWSCYPSTFNATECNAVKSSFRDGFFRSGLSGSMQDWIWEEQGMQRCALETASTGQCLQGRVPVYGVQAESVDDVQKTVLFSAQHNLRLFVKSTGHDYLGRSTSAGSFLLWMHHLNGIVVNMSFVPQACPQAASYPGPAVTVTGGSQWRDVYAAVHSATNDKYVVVGGMCPSVGAAGGYVLGGGHSPLSPSFGLSVDNILQYEIVTADGSLHVVNECQDPDLFWALRGGGGGTFGVVTSMTYQLQLQPRSLTSFQVNVAPAADGQLLNSEQVQQLFTIFMQFAGRMDDARWGGYVEINILAGLAATFLIPQDETTANQTIGPFLAAFQQMVQNGVVTVNPRIKAQPSFYEWKVNHVWPATDIDATGDRLQVGSRLIPKSALQDPVGLAATLAKAAGFADDFLGLLVPGQGVRERDTNSQSTAVTPAWRNAFLHAAFLSAWADDTPDSGVATKEAGLQSALDVLREAFPNSGGYFGEANLEPNWRQTFWGTVNYERLLNIKKRVDPNGLFVCTQCVGSEEWDTEGNCRVQSPDTPKSEFGNKDN